MAQSTSRLPPFDPFAIHPFTNGASGSPPGYSSYASGIPIASYPTHVVNASTSPNSKSQPSSAPSQATPVPTSGNASAAPIQSPQPRSHPSQARADFSTGAAVRPPQEKQAIFESFHKQRLTPDLDDLPLRKTNAWGTRELEESMSSRK